MNLAIYLIAALVNSLPYQTFSSINTIVSKNFDIEPVVVTLNVLLFSILNPIFSFPVNWILDKYGMKIGCSAGGVLLITGVWLRTLLTEGQVFWCVCGTILSSVGCMFILSSPTILGNNWFKPATMPVVIFFAVTMNLISGTLGSSFPGLVIK